MWPTIAFIIDPRAWGISLIAIGITLTALFKNQRWLIVLGMIFIIPGFLLVTGSRKED